MYIGVKKAVLKTIPTYYTAYTREFQLIFEYWLVFIIKNIKTKVISCSMWRKTSFLNKRNKKYYAEICFNNDAKCIIIYSIFIVRGVFYGK